MAEATIVPVVKSILGKLTLLAGAEKMQYSNNFSRQVKITEQLLRAFCDICQDSDVKQYVYEDIKVWLGHIKNVVYGIDDHLDAIAFRILEDEVMWTKSDYLSRFFESSKLRYLYDRLEKLLEVKNNFGLRECLLETPMAQKTPTLLEAYENGSQKIIGRNKEIEDITIKILDLLNVGGPSVLAVVGMGGIGKTALAKLVYTDVGNYFFDIKLWVSNLANSNISIPRILQCIIEAGTGEITSTKCKEELVAKIKLAFNNKSYLLVMDDVWVESNLFWVELKSILDFGKGGVILITTRSHEVASRAQSVDIYNLKFLPDSECWSIFKRLAFREGEEERFPRLSEIGKSVVQKCGGVPLVAVWLGSLLQSERDEGEWLRIEKMDVTNLRKDSVMPFLKVAYDKLPSHLKPCFAYLALNQGNTRGVWPHQAFFWNALGLLQVRYEKDVETFAYLALNQRNTRGVRLHQAFFRNALGLLQVRDEKDIETCAQTYLMELLSRSILHDSLRTSSKRIISCKIHDQLHDLAMEVLGEDLAVVTWKELKVSKLSRHVVWGYEEPDALSDKNFPEELLKAKRARTFRFGYPVGRISQSFLRGIISNLYYLRILDLGYSHFEELPYFVEYLKHLRVLNMSFNPIIKSLPVTIILLLNLQAFYLEGCEQLVQLPLHLHRLRSLKCFTVTTCERRCRLRLDNMPALEELQFLSCKQLVSLWNLYDSGKLIHLRRLHVHDCPELASLPSMRQLVDLEELVISYCESLDLDIRSLHDLVSIQYLEISGVPRLSRLPPGIKSAANTLQYFLLRDCIGLVELPDWLNSFAHLHSFVIYRCPNLLTLPEGFRHFKSLKVLKIKGCPNLSRWFETPEGFSIIKYIPRIEIDGRLITQNMNKQERSAHEDDEASSSAQISYLHVNRKEMKLHFCLFPDNYEFERETLVQLWMAAGFFRSGRMEELARIYFDSFLREGHILRVGIDNLSGVCKYINNVDKVVNVSTDGPYTLLKDENMEVEGTKRLHISVVSSYINQKTFETLKRYDELRTLLFIRNYGPALKQVPSDMFLSLQCMESLDLSGSHIKELPGSIGNVTQLRYLDVSFTLIERLPETIDRLVELQTLKLKGCKKLHTLPEGMKKLTSLRHLYFDVIGQLSFMPKGVGALTELRTLSAFIVDAEGGHNITELMNMNNLRGSFCISGLENVLSKNFIELVLVNKKYLTQIQLRWDEYDETVEGNDFSPVSYLEPHPCLEKLEILCYPNARLPSWICNEKFQNLTSITFLKCENKTLNISLGRLPNLKCLNIIQMNKVKKIDHSIHTDVGCVSFPKLEELTIDGMSDLESWTAVTDRHFPLLSKLSIKYCPKMQTLPFLALLRSLEYLEISYCPKLKFLSDGKLSEKLMTLMVDGCPLLKCSMVGEDWNKIEHVPEKWFDLENVSSPAGNNHSDSEDTVEGNSGNKEAEL